MSYTQKDLGDWIVVTHLPSVLLVIPKVEFRRLGSRRHSLLYLIQTYASFGHLPNCMVAKFNCSPCYLDLIFGRWIPISTESSHDRAYSSHDFGCSDDRQVYGCPARSAAQDHDDWTTGSQEQAFTVITSAAAFNDGHLGRHGTSARPSHLR